MSTTYAKLNVGDRVVYHSYYNVNPKGEGKVLAVTDHYALVKFGYFDFRAQWITRADLERVTDSNVPSESKPTTEERLS